MNIATLSLPDPHPIYKCNRHLELEYVYSLNVQGKYVGRLQELAHEMDIRQIHTGKILQDIDQAEARKEFVELMQTCKACRQQAILYGNYKAKNLPEFKEQK